MIVRDYEPLTDREAVERIHREQGMDYKFPDIDQPLFIIKKVAVNENGDVIGAELLRIQAEAYLMLSPDLDPVQKMNVIGELSPAVEQEAFKQGLDDICAYIPEDIDKKFSKRLLSLGWNKIRTGWNCWVRELN